ncbi:MAG: hypothetical protein CVU39_06165 [Chloroflexi bacterium HGW-Chloroflexi-10]|nr:MAG: hypothetical protein CVU39_06165 [Chloroflexi bacterium HGW-Chloroflexi-10]
MVAKSSESGGVPRSLTLGVDASHWQPEIDWPMFYKEGVRFAIVKASQGSYSTDALLKKHLYEARAAGMIVGVYHWHDPNNAPALQLDKLVKAVTGLDFDFLAVDVEQYWQDWEEWKVQRVTKKFSGKKISDSALQLANLVKSKFGKETLIYTRASFVKEYAPEMETWLPDWPLWLAHYPYGMDRIRTSWATLKKTFLPKISGPWRPDNCDDWHFWQWSGDKFVLPGCETALDLNYFNGDENGLREFLGLVPVIPELSMEEKVNILWAAYQKQH